MSCIHRQQNKRAICCRWKKERCLLAAGFMSAGISVSIATRKSEFLPLHLNGISLRFTVLLPRPHCVYIISNTEVNFLLSSALFDTLSLHGVETWKSSKVQNVLSSCMPRTIFPRKEILQVCEANSVFCQGEWIIVKQSTGNCVLVESPKQRCTDALAQKDILNTLFWEHVFHPLFVTCFLFNKVVAQISWKKKKASNASCSEHGVILLWTHLLLSLILNVHAALSCVCSSFPKRGSALSFKPSM